MPFPVEAAFVARTEQLLGIELPTHYKLRMQARNGGTFQLEGEDWELYPIFDDSDPKRAKRTCNDVLHETREAREWASFPPHAVAIAGNAAGDQLILLPDSEGSYVSSTIYRWDHERGSIAEVLEHLPNAAD